MSPTIPEIDYFYIPAPSCLPVYIIANIVLLLQTFATLFVDIPRKLNDIIMTNIDSKATNFEAMSLDEKAKIIQPRPYFEKKKSYAPARTAWQELSIIIKLWSVIIMQDRLITIQNEFSKPKWKKTLNTKSLDKTTKKFQLLDNVTTMFLTLDAMLTLGKHDTRLEELGYKNKELCKQYDIVTLSDFAIFVMDMVLAKADKEFPIFLNSNPTNSEVPELVKEFNVSDIDVFISIIQQWIPVLRDVLQKCREDPSQKIAREYDHPLCRNIIIDFGNRVHYFYTTENSAHRQILLAESDGLVIPNLLGETGFIRILFKITPKWLLKILNRIFPDFKYYYQGLCGMTLSEYLGGKNEHKEYTNVGGKQHRELVKEWDKKSGGL